MGRRKVVADEELLQHARDVFLERGASGSTKEIARRAGMSEATLFQRYPTKAALFLAALVPPRVDVEAIVRAPTRAEDPRQALAEIGRRMLAYYRTLIPTVVHLMTHPSISMAAVAAHFGQSPERALVDALATYLREAAGKGRIRADAPLATAGLLVSAIHSLALFEMLEVHGRRDMEQAIDGFVAALWNGLSPWPGSGATPANVSETKKGAKR